jgi:hypothetical protein
LMRGLRGWCTAGTATGWDMTGTWGTRKVPARYMAHTHMPSACCRARTLDSCRLWGRSERARMLHTGHKCRKLQERKKKKEHVRPLSKGKRERFLCRLWAWPVVTPVVGGQVVAAQGGQGGAGGGHELAGAVTVGPDVLHCSCDNTPDVLVVRGRGKKEKIGERYIKKIRRVSCLQKKGSFFCPTFRACSRAKRAAGGWSKGTMWPAPSICMKVRRPCCCICNPQV